jgi:hypothetical protein
VTTHAAGDFHVYGRGNAPEPYPICGVLLAGWRKLRVKDVPFHKISCRRCKRMDEFKDLMRKGEPCVLTEPTKEDQ